MQKEIWKDVPGYEGLYQVSSFGRVKSNCRRKEKIISGGICGSGYKAVFLTNNKIRKSFMVHKLVAYAFLNHNEKGRYVHVDHIDGNRLNNDLSNLQVISSRENTSKAIKRKSKYIGVSHIKSCNMWMARIEHIGLRKYLGCFRCETKAHIAYQKALKELPI